MSEMLKFLSQINNAFNKYQERIKNLQNEIDEYSQRFNDKEDRLNYDNLTREQ